MGTWSTESFGNDNAADWALELADALDLSLIEDTLQSVLDAGDDLVDSPQGEEAIAAADVVARLKGRFGTRDPFSEPVDKWVQAHPMTPSSDLISQAIRAIDRITSDPSELLDCWRESEHLQEWMAAIEDLKSRLLGRA
jgi:hypothetical protein